MKKVIFSLALFLTCSLLGYAQKGISYQAVILDPKPIEIPGQDITGQPFVNGAVSLKFKIFSSTFVQEFEEVHATQTDAYGMVNVLIGSVSQSAFSSLVWDSKQKSLQVLVSFDQGGTYTKVSEQVLTYNPMALFAETASKLSETLSIAGGGTGATTAAAARTNLGLGNVDNTADAAKPISTATQAALDTKANADEVNTALATKANAAEVNTALATKANAAEVTSALATKANANEVTSALATKANASDVTTSLGLKEDVSNKANTPLGNSTSLYPTQNAVKIYVDAQIASATIADASSSTKGKIQLAGDLAGTAAAPTVPGLALKANASDVTTALAVKADTAYVLTKVAAATIADASSSTKGKIQLAGDLAGTAAAPTVPGLALKANASEVTTALAVKADTAYVLTKVAAATIADASSSTKGKIQLAGDLAGTAAAPTVPGLALKAPLASPTFTGTVTTAAINTGALSSTAVSAPTYASAPRTLTYSGSTINWNPALGLNAAITLTQNSTLSFTAAPPVGSYGTVVLTQDGTGGRTLTLPTLQGATNQVLGSTSTSTVALSTAASSKDILNFYYDGTVVYWNIGQGYGAAAATAATNLGTGVTGTLGVTNGGTGAATLIGLVKGNGTGAMTAAVAGTDYQAPLTLSTSGSGAATLVGTTLTIPTPAAFALPTASASTVGGVKVGSNLSIDGNGELSAVLSAANISGTLAVGKGGTGATTLTGYVKGTGTTAMTASATIPVADVTGAAPLASPTFTGAVTAPIYATTPQALTFGSPISWNPANGLNASVTLTGNGTLSFSSPPTAGAYGTLVVTQDATGGKTLTLPTATNKVLGSATTTAIALSTAANAIDIVNFYYDGSNYFWNVGQGYGAAAIAASTDLASSVTGTLSVANGGTGAANLSGLVKGNGTGAMTAAAAGTDYLAPNGSAASLTNFPTLNQNTTGNAATVTTNANLTGDVTSVGNAATVVKINGTSLESLPTGILKNTTATGVPTIAVAGTDYQAPLTLSTSGSGAATLVGTTLTIPTPAAFALPTASASTVGGVKVGSNLSIDGNGELSAVLSAANISGTLAVGKGGTGATTLTGYVKGTGTTAMTASATIPVADVTGAAPLASPTFTGAVTAPIYATTPQALTFGSPISWNPANGLNASVTLTGNGTLSFSSPPTAGAYGTLVVTQDATGGKTLTLPTATNKVLGSATTTAIALSTAANAIDIVNFYYDGSNYFWNVGQGYGTAAISTATNLAGGAAGSIPYQTASGATSLLAKGTDGQILTLASGLPSWAAAPATGVTSVAMSTPTGLTVTGSPITSSGTLALSMTTGYAIPTTASQTNWDAAYTNRITSASSPLSISSNALSLGTVPVSSGGTGATTLTANNVLLGNGTSALQAVAPGNSGNVLTSNGTTWSSTAPAALGVPYSGATGAVNLGSYELTANGVVVGRGASSKSNNYAYGYAVLSANTTGNYNNAFGHQALTANTTGQENNAFGEYVLPKNIGGNYNTAMGSNALKENTSGSGNTGFGRQALQTNSTGSNNTALGHQANVSVDGLSNATAIGNGATVTASNTIQLGNTDVTNVKTSGTITAGDITYPKTHGSANQVLTTSGSGTLTWATPSTTATAYSGTLPIANGGTNSTATATSGGIGYGTGTAHAYTSAGSSGQVLISAGAGAPTWATLTAGTAITISNSGGTITIAAAVRPMTEQVTATSAHAVATATFTLANTPLNTKVWMFINGVRTNNLAYTVSGTTVTYTAANNSNYTIVAGDRIQFDYAY
jgi:hypothetical protein